MKYRITVTETHRFVLEGEGDLPFAEDRIDQIACGLLSEAENEVSSYHNDKPQIKLELLMDEESGTWLEVVE